MDPIHDESDRFVVNFNYDYPVVFISFGRIKAKSGTQIHHRNDPSAEIDHPLNFKRALRNTRQRHHPVDFMNR